MSDRFQNGLQLVAPSGASSRAGRTFCRWLVEFLTQCCGWTVHDSVSGTGWTNVASSGSDAASVVGKLNQISMASGSFSSSDIGSYITLVNLSNPSRDGIYKINNVLNPTTLGLEIRYGVHEFGIPTLTSGATWRIWRPDTTYTPAAANVIVLKGTGTTGGAYDFHLHITVKASDAANSCFPQFIISPFASWNNSTHVWNDAKHTSAKGIDAYNSSINNVDSCRVWVHGNTNHFTLMIRMEDDTISWHYVYGGEIDAFLSSTLDPKPCVIYTGSGNGSTDSKALIGTGGDSTINGGGKWLAEDDLTECTGYLSFAHCSPNNDYNWVSLLYRRWSQYSRNLYKQELMVESKTASHMEHRGILRDCWVTARDYSILAPYGSASEYLHIVSGISIKWNGSRVWYERG